MAMFSAFIGIIKLMWSDKLYSVVTLYECMQDPATVAWLMQMDIPLPGTIPPGRYLAPNKVKRILDALSGVRIDYLIGKTTWQVTVRSRKDVSWATLAVRDYSGDPTASHKFIFTGGWDEMILQVTAALVKFCGPLVLLHESGAPPQIVM